MGLLKIAVENLSKLCTCHCCLVKENAYLRFKIKFVFPGRFNIPEKGELFDEVSFPELDEKNATKTVHDYHSDGQRAKRTGRDEYYPKKKGRYDDRRSGDRRHYGSGGSMFMSLQFA